MPQVAPVHEVAVEEHRAQPEPVAERVVEQIPVAPAVVAPAVEIAPAVIAPAVPVARDPIVLPSDLQQVETDAEKLRLAASKIEPSAPPRTPRVRPPLPPISNEPLVQVETRK
jgi:ribonuclease E